MVQVVELLDELESDADEEEFLQLLNNKALWSQNNCCSCAESAKDDEDIEQIPTAFPVSSSESKEADNDIDAVDEAEKQKENVYTHT